MEKIAPSFLAEQWDNIGLQVGHEKWPVRKVWVALDPADALMRNASGQGVDLVITHHPLLFKPLNAIDPETLAGRIISVALKEKIGIFCAHTNLDSAEGGVNDMLANRIGVFETRPLENARDDLFRLVTYVPEGHEDRVANALFASGAGHSQKYSNVSFRSAGTGTFKPSAEANPFKGTAGETCHLSEHRIEILVEGRELPQVKNALLAVHPYEEVVYDVYSVGCSCGNQGLGRIGDLDRELSVEAFALQISRALGVEKVKLAGNRDQKVRRVALCAGSGKSLVPSFLASEAQVFVGGDFGYHDGRIVEDSGRVLMDVGHFASEHVLVEGLAERLDEALVKGGRSIEVAAYKDERDCFYFV
jgi:dinuclear metal center YbgI/SA1388 family protein